MQPFDFVCVGVMACYYCGVT